MGGLFDYDSKLFQMLVRISDIVILSVLWLLCSLPIVTIGASTSALYYTTMKLVRQRGDSAISMFFHAFRENFKESIPVTILLLAIGYALVVDYSLLAEKMGGNLIFHGLCIVVLVLYATFASLLFPVLAKFRCTLKQLLRNVLLLMVQHPLVTVAVTSMHLIPFWLIYDCLEWIERLEWCLFLFGPGGIAYINAMMLVPMFQHYIKEEQQEGDR